MQLTFNNQYQRYKQIFGNIVVQYNKREDLKKYFELFLSLTSVVVFSVFAIKPTINTIIGLTKEIKAKEATIEQMNKKIENLKKAQSIYYQYQTSIDLLEKVLPNTPTPDTFVAQIEGVSSNSNIDITNLSLGEMVIKGTSVKKQSSGYDKTLPAKTSQIDFSYSAKGKYENIINLMKNIDLLARPIKINSIGISKKVNPDSGEISIILNMSGKSIYFNENEVPVKPVIKNEE